MFGMLIGIGEKFFRVFIALFVSILLARYYGPSDFGLLSYVIAFASIFSSVITLGLDEIANRDFASKTTTNDNIAIADRIYTVFMLRFASALICYIAFLIILYIKFEYTLPFKIGSIVAIYFIAQIFDTYEIYLRSQLKIKYITVSRFVSGVISSIVKVSLVYFKFPIISQAFALVLDYIIAAVFFRSKVYPSLSANPKFSLVYANDLLKKSWPLVVSGFLFVLQARISIIIIEEFLGVNSVGQFAVALKFIDIFDIFASVFVIFLIPKLVNIKKWQYPLYSRLVYAGVLLFYAMAIPILIAIIIIFPYMYGDQYAQAYALLPWLIFRPFFIILYAARTIILIFENKLILNIYTSIVGFFISYSVAYLMIPIYGLYGVVISIFLSSIFSTFILDYFFHRKNFVALFTCYRVFRHVNWYLTK